MATQPLLKQTIDLRSADFDEHPVWVHCHTIDYDEPWYDDTDEETFRPWLSPHQPVDPNEAIFLLAADFTLADGTRLPGYATPPSPGTVADLCTTQPCLFVSDEAFSFWGGMFGVPAEVRERLYASLGKSSAAVFPIAFRSRQGITPHISGSIPGFLKMGDHTTTIET